VSACTHSFLADWVHHTFTQDNFTPSQPHSLTLHTQLFVFHTLQKTGNLKNRDLGGAVVASQMFNPEDDEDDDEQEYYEEEEEPEEAEEEEGEEEAVDEEEG